MESIIRSSNGNIKHSLLCWRFGSRYHRRNPIRHVEHHIRHPNLPIFSNGDNRFFHLVINYLTNKDMARRILDFLSGVAYANRGKIKRVATNTYIIIPSNVDLTGDDLLDELENNGVYFG